MVSNESPKRANALPYFAESYVNGYEKLRADIKKGYEMRRKTGLGIIKAGLILGAVFLTSCSSSQQTKYARSFDGERIAYHTAGRGDVTLLFVHGWSCDSRYWREQVPVFAKEYQVITMDLAGHGDSGQTRKVYSIESFAEDVIAVIEKTGSKKVIVIGHSFGGEIVSTAASMEQKTVIGIIGVDTLHNVEESYSREQARRLIGIDNFRKDFKAAAKVFIEQMMVKDVNQQLLQWVIDDMSSAPPEVGISALEEYTGTIADKKMINIFSEMKTPLICINADLWPTNPEANRRHIKSYDVKIMKGVGHFPMLERPDEFNRLLGESIKEIIAD
jgi:pimeloyl-ACP methyl ester carboxylesterase